jgi:hypothetical protein
MLNIFMFVLNDEFEYRRNKLSAKKRKGYQLLDNPFLTNP